MLLPLAIRYDSTDIKLIFLYGIRFLHAPTYASIRRPSPPPNLNPPPPLPRPRTAPLVVADYMRGGSSTGRY